MPITITPSSPNGFMGPGLGLELQSDFVGPLPTGSYFKTTFFQSGSELPVFTSTMPTNDTFLNYAPFLGFSDESLELDLLGITEGSTTTVQSELHQVVSGVDTTLDTGSDDFPYSSLQGIPAMLRFIKSSVPTSTFTSSDRTLLNDTAAAVADVLAGITTTVTTATGTLTTSIGALFQPITLDALTLQEVTSGETCDPVTAGDLEFFFGAVVRCTTIPDYYGVGGYDGRHYEPALALLNIYRGTEQVARIPIHVADYMLTPVPGQNNSTEAQIVYLAVSPNLSLEVWWGNGVCGRVYLLRLP